ncbi:unnamed protein product [Nippostrongylus brasiliensis]|uniref:Lipoprotein n=1 Tax=Nippostrongylus brasiliensis TaxID=27835 RepID=A0A0N4YDR5_NIPBR|nr:unnamed protein product [Nippostrongylus brasiliensis]
MEKIDRNIQGTPGSITRALQALASSAVSTDFPYTYKVEYGGKFPSMANLGYFLPSLILDAALLTYDPDWDYSTRTQHERRWQTW